MLYENAKTDWLSTKTIFFDEKRGIISDNINDLIDYSNLEIDPAGLYGYMDFGFSVFGRTPIKNVHFLQPNSEISKVKNADGTYSLKIQKLKDPVEELIHQPSNVGDTLEYMEYIIEKDYKESSDQKWVLPLSGGFDSRLLAFFCPEKGRISAYTYGTSRYDEKSMEVVIAKMLAENLGFQHTVVSLTHYNDYITKWLDLYGVSTHCHGMYFMEFYDKLKELIPENGVCFSGIIGDAWAGTVNISAINSISDMNKLGYTHGMRMNPHMCKIKRDISAYESFYDLNRDKLLDERWNTVFAMRNKMMLLSSLIKIPESVGMEVKAPYLNIELAMKMLNLPTRIRRERQWQVDFLEKNNILFSSNMVNGDSSNCLNAKVLSLNRPKQLNVNVLREYFDEKYLDWVNQCILRRTFLPECKGNWFRQKYAVAQLRYNDWMVMKGYYAYLTLKPIEDILIKRG